MRRILLWALGLVVMFTAGDARAADTVRVGFCARTLTSAVAPFAIANKMGWFAGGAFKVELVPLAGSVDCVKFVGTGELRYALPSIEPLAGLRPQGVTAKSFYTAYQGNTYSIAVPADSPIKTLDALKGKKIGVASMASGGAFVARAIAADIGEPDLPIIAIGEGAQAMSLVKAGQVDALALYDTQYAVIDTLGLKLRMIPHKDFDRFPGNGFIALDTTLAQHRAEAVALAQGYAKGEIFAFANPAAAVRILWAELPQTKATGKDETQALADDVKTLTARLANMRLARGGVKRWGEANMANYQAYLDFLLKWGQIKEAIKAEDVVTNELVADINAFDPKPVEDAAKAAK